MRSRQEIIAWLAAQGHPQEWADTLDGLPDQYVEPIVNIAATTHNHPAIVLATAASYSRDPVFVAAARAQFSRPPSQPNRAERRKDGRSGRGPTTD